MTIIWWDFYQEILAETESVESLATEAVKNEQNMVKSIAQEAVNVEAEIAAEAEFLIKGWWRKICIKFVR